MEKATLWTIIVLGAVGLAGSIAGVVAILIKGKTERTLWLLTGWLFACAAIGGNVLYRLRPRRVTESAPL